MMYCPVCDNQELKEITKSGLNFYFCQKCKGVAVKKDDFKMLLLKIKENIKITKAKIDVLEYAKQPMPFLNCPNCKYNLYKVENKGLVVDYCLNCGLIWFDEGELAIMLNRLKEGNLIVFESANYTDDEYLNLIFSIVKK